jgi:hypothetical protein
VLTIFVALVSKHICEELELSSKKKRRLIADEYGIRNLNDLLQLESRLDDGELGSMEEEMKQKLVVAATWKRENPEKEVLEFCSDVWDDYKRKDAEINGNDFTSAEMDGSVVDAQKVCQAIGTTDVGVCMDAQMKVSLPIISPSFLWNKYSNTPSPV